MSENTAARGGTSATGESVGTTGTSSAPVPPVPMLARPARPSTRVGTILWGVALVAFASYTLSTVVTNTQPDPLTWITGSLIIGGIALVAIGITAAIRRR